MHIATISSQRQITLPKAVMDEVGLKIGDRVVLSVSGKTLLIEKTKNFMNYSGAFHHLVPTKPFSPKTIEKRMREFKKLEYEQNNQATG